MGIDYGRGMTNVSDKTAYQDRTNIRFGVIPQNEVLQAWCDESEACYGSPHCPSCGAELDDDVCDGHECECGYVIEWIGDECYGDEPLYHEYNGDGYEAQSDSYGDIFLTRSPYYTRCGYCSPCAPGAGYIIDGGDDCYAYCFSPDWFDGECPYPVWDVRTGQLLYTPNNREN